MFYNVIGGVLWGTGVTVLGYFLGQIPFVATNIELILVGIVLLSILPIIIEYLRARAASRRGGSARRTAPATPQPKD